MTRPFFPNNICTAYMGLRTPCMPVTEQNEGRSQEGPKLGVHSGYTPARTMDMRLGALAVVGESPPAGGRSADAVCDQRRPSHARYV
jgi:hypothetical protein